MAPIEGQDQCFVFRPVVIKYPLRRESGPVTFANCGEDNRIYQRVLLTGERVKKLQQRRYRTIQIIRGLNKKISR